MPQPTETMDQPGGLSRRSVEVIVALCLIGLAGLVLYDSHGRGAGWDGGPQNGFFPARVGWIFLAASAYLLWKSVRRPPETFVTWWQLGQVARVLAPLVLFVALIAPLGLYVAAALFIIAFMLITGKARWWSVVLAAVLVPLACFWIFELQFRVPLPKGPLEAALGY
ncbi:tripartite tricarboxylate transporter TctB family protein [Teichococcus vastitatis]|uniref:Tripartite tricarboxylate transporter TctB family protein n=1 Tax=Teichococcus vastitatis TaxID=2307076 RepID=A0ABS9W3K5_9PROT|nr:tripartite tricarboxylate transporter TctB family protein [Pseudoroseomonas vastitatis]MCI0753638.1 tripartite tricarboxylate transporter TctB family protein [Pseudoroseomonas vastitatis]